MTNICEFLFANWRNFLPLCGLVLVLVGAVIVVSSVFTTKDSAGAASVSTFASSDPADWSDTEAAKGLMRASSGALWGFLFVLLGTALQAAPLIAAIWFE